MDRLRHLILPAVVLGVNEAGTLVRYVRSSMLEILDQDYLHTARSKGLKESIVINKHAFKNAMLSIITITGLEIVTLLGGSVVTEQIFQWPGIGQLTISSVMSRLAYAARVSLLVGIGTVILSVGIGTILGLISGYFDGKIDMLIMRITDIFMSFPQMMLILVVVSIVGPGLGNIIWVLGFPGWPSVARLVRGNVLSIKEMDYVKSSVALGFGTPRILFSHILPNTMALVSTRNYDCNY